MVSYELEMTFFFCCTTAVRSYKQPLDLIVWSHCYLEHSYLPSPFFPAEFEHAANAILFTQLNMTRADITVANSKLVYLHLCNVMSFWCVMLLVSTGQGIAVMIMKSLVSGPFIQALQVSKWDVYILTLMRATGISKYSRDKTFMV